MSKFKKVLKIIFILLIVQIIVLPVLVFYGPFENVKRIVVGSSYYSLNHRYVAEFFLSDKQIAEILKQDSAIFSYSSNLQNIQSNDFTNVHSDKLEIHDLASKGVKGNLLIVEDPTRIEVGYLSKMNYVGETTSAIAKKNNAIAAINAGGFMNTNWAGTGGVPTGFVIHNKKVIYNQIKDEKVKQDTIAFTDKGMLIVGTHSIEDLKKYNIKEGISFGPPLIVNGRPVIKKGDGGWGIAPRTAIAQREDGSVLMLTIDGRNLTAIGATLKEVQDILLEYGAINAANLDGGASTTMYYNGKTINTPSSFLGERTVPTIFFVRR